MRSWLDRTFSLTKKTSISICLVFLWKIWLWAIATALWLSQSSIGVEKGTWSSCNKAWTQVNSAKVWAIPRYSASVLNLTVTYCFLDHQEIKLGPKKTPEPEVDLLLSTSKAQSASHMVVIHKGFPIAASFMRKP